MKKALFVITIFLLTFGACRNKKTENSSENASSWKIENIEDSKVVFLNGDSTAGGMKLTITFKFPSKYRNDSTLKSIQSAFVFAFAGNEYTAMSPQEAFDAVLYKNTQEAIEIGKLASQDGPDFSHFFKNITTDVVDTTEIFITAMTYVEDYTGGAHGTHHTEYYNIKTENGEILKNADLFKDSSHLALKELIETQLKEIIRHGKELFIFDWESVMPNENFQFNSEGIVFVYNEYEIAPYSDGLIEVTVPYSSLKNIATPELEKIILLKTKRE